MCAAVSVIVSHSSRYACSLATSYAVGKILNQLSSWQTMCSLLESPSVFTLSNASPWQSSYLMPPSTHTISFGFPPLWVTHISVSLWYRRADISVDYSIAVQMGLHEVVICEETKFRHSDGSCYLSRHLRSVCARASHLLLALTFLKRFFVYWATKLSMVFLADNKETELTGRGILVPVWQVRPLSRFRGCLLGWDQLQTIVPAVTEHYRKAFAASDFWTVRQCVQLKTNEFPGNHFLFYCYSLCSQYAGASTTNVGGKMDLTRTQYLPFSITRSVDDHLVWTNILIHWTLHLE